MGSQPLSQKLCFKPAHHTWPGPPCICTRPLPPSLPGFIHYLSLLQQQNTVTAVEKQARPPFSEPLRDRKCVEMRDPVRFEMIPVATIIVGARTHPTFAPMGKKVIKP